jgi:hypothetical protein
MLASRFLCQVCPFSKVPPLLFPISEPLCLASSRERWERLCHDKPYLSFSQPHRPFLRLRKTSPTADPLSLRLAARHAQPRLRTVVSAVYAHDIHTANQKSRMRIGSSTASHGVVTIMRTLRSAGVSPSDSVACFSRSANPVSNSANVSSIGRLSVLSRK